MIQVSFFHTQYEYQSGAKDLTRRVNWRVKPGEHFMGIDRAQGIPKGGHRHQLGESICYSVKEEPVDEIIRRPFRPDRLGVLRSEALREGFPGFVGNEEKFVNLLIKINKAARLKRDSIIKRVEFDRIPSTTPSQHLQQEEQEIFRLKCSHHKVCRYLCTQVCPYRNPPIPPRNDSDVLDSLIARVKHHIGFFDNAYALAENPYEKSEAIGTIAAFKLILQDYEQLRQQQGEQR